VSLTIDNSYRWRDNAVGVCVYISLSKVAHSYNSSIPPVRVWLSY